MRAIAGAFIGFVVGFIAAFILFIPTCVVASVATSSSRRGEDIAEQVKYVPWVIAIIGFSIGLAADIHTSREHAELEQRRLEEAAAQREAERQERQAKEARKVAAAEEKKQRDESEERRRQALSQWSQQLRSRPVEWLRFEYEKRQRSVQALQTKLDRLSREQSELWAQHDRWLNDDNATNYNPRVYTNLDVISRCEGEITHAEEEMVLLQRALDSK